MNDEQTIAIMAAIIYSNAQGSTRHRHEDAVAAAHAIFSSCSISEDNTGYRGIEADLKSRLDRVRPKDNVADYDAGL